uniref:Uncharacterized protein n=1 Tax=Pyramimonas orientalis virus TaxID=455367 RepID=A0A7M3UNV3_POV01|nr:hypothetical protein HWQ62_00255 [Pyramimonas orientalis virus]
MSTVTLEPQNSNIKPNDDVVMDNDVKQDINNDQTTDNDTKYDRIVKVSLYVSAWMLSCVLLYTYNSKRTANIEYNKLVTRVNTNKLNEQIKKYNTKCEEYVKLAFPINMMNSIDELDPSGVTMAKKEMYTELIKTIEIYEKCNYIKMNTEGAPFPMSEILISCLLLLVIIGFIAVSNFTNNPFQKLNIEDDVNNIKQMIEDSIKTTSTNQSTQQGGSYSKESSTQLDLYNDLTRKEMEIVTRINFLKSDSTFNYVSLSFTVMIFSFYISYKMLNSSMRFKENLYSGSMFMKSRCYQ